MANELNSDAGEARIGDPCTMVIFGAGGDLTKRKLLPALYNLKVNNLLPNEFAIIGFSNNQFNSEQFRESQSKDIHEFATTKVDDETWNWFNERIEYVQCDFADPAAYKRLAEMIDKVDKQHSTKGNCLFYLAIAPRFFAVAVKQLGDAGLTTEENGRWRRVIIEKPFGRDLESAHALNADIKKTLEENQIYRIDHYLGKETVQNLMAFRFSNGIFEPIWNSRYIDHVQITAAETVGVEERGGYYDQSGALRDMVPNHVMQLIAMVAMEPPYSFDADAVRDEKAKVLHAIPPIKAEEALQTAVRGQYGAGTEDGKPVPAYRTEDQVKRDSNTETYAALKLHIDNWRWSHVPFYVRTGKRMKRRLTEIAIQFKRAPFTLFRDTPVEATMPNRLLVHIQPDEGISLGFSAKIPGPTMKLGQVDMNFKYSDYFGAAPSTGYETLILDCMIGDPTLFQRDDMVEAGWRIINPLLDLWKALPAREFPNYPAGSWGPKEADHLLEKDGHQWCFHNEK
jgi:glucose-6-phosphate 1-dehydrogenase